MHWAIRASQLVRTNTSLSSLVESRQTATQTQLCSQQHSTGRATGFGREKKKTEGADQDIAEHCAFIYMRMLIKDEEIVLEKELYFDNNCFDKASPFAHIN